MAARPTNVWPSASRHSPASVHRAATAFASPLLNDAAKSCDDFRIAASSAPPPAGTCDRDIDATNRPAVAATIPAAATHLVVIGGPPQVSNELPDSSPVNYFSNAKHLRSVKSIRTG